MVIFVTGASGYLGSQLIQQLSETHKCVSLVRKSSSLSRLQGIDSDIVYVDELTSLERAFRIYNPDFVINTVALYGRKNESISDLVQANILFPANLYALSQKYNCRAFIHTGTSLPSEVSIYAETKNTFVNLIKRNHNSSMKFICLALEHFYGAGDERSKFTSYVIDSCLRNQSLNLTSGLQKRDFIYIDDVINAYKTLISNIKKLDNFEVIPVGSGNAPSVRFFVELVCKIAKSKSKLNFGVVPVRENELMLSCADTSRLNELGWILTYPLELGIEKVISNDKRDNNLRD